MGGIDHRNAEPRPRRQRQLRRVGEMRVDHIRQPFGLRQIVEERLHQRGNFRGEVFFAQIPPLRRPKPPDRQAAADLLLGLGVHGPKAWFIESTGHDLHRIHIAPRRLRAGRPQDIGDVTAGIFGHAIVDRRRREAAPEGNVTNEHEWVSLWRGDPPHSPSVPITNVNAYIAGQRGWTS